MFDMIAYLFLKLLTEWGFHSWSFNQASNLIYTWILASIDSYTISLRFNSLEDFNTQFYKNEFQPSSIIAQIQIKARINHKVALKDMQVKILMHQERNESF